MGGFKTLERKYEALLLDPILNSGSTSIRTGLVIKRGQISCKEDNRWEDRKGDKKRREGTGKDMCREIKGEGKAQFIECPILNNSSTAFQLLD